MNYFLWRKKGQVCTLKFNENFLNNNVKTQKYINFRIGATYQPIFYGQEKLSFVPQD